MRGAQKPSAPQLARLVERVKVVVGANVDDMAVRRALIMARFDVQSAIVRFFDGSFDVAAARPTGAVGGKRKRVAAAAPPPPPPPPAAAAMAPSTTAEDDMVSISPRRAALVTTPLTIAWGLASGQPACRGRGLLAVNDIVQCWRDGPKSRFVRFGRDRKRAIGSLGRDVAFLAVLLDAGAVTVDGVCQACPPELMLLSRVSIMLRINIAPGGRLRGSVFDAKATGHSTTLRSAAFALLAWLFPAVALSLSGGGSGGCERSSGASPDVVDLVLRDGGGDAAAAEAEAGSGAGAVAADGDEDDSVAPPAALRATLWPHQLVAMRWMMGRERNTYANSAKGGDADGDAGVGDADDGDERAGAPPAAIARDGEGSSSGGAVADLLRQNPLWIRCALAQAGAGALYANPYSRATRIAPPRQPAACRGGILADDMGMGKTICVLALILADKARLRSSLGGSEEGTRAPSPFAAAMRARAKQRAPTLIVVPMTCLGQWVDEFKKHSKRGALVVKPYYGGASRARAGAAAACAAQLHFVHVYILNCSAEIVVS